jgi:hypothetical protein
MMLAGNIGQGEMVFAVPNPYHRIVFLGQFGRERAR